MTQEGCSGKRLVGSPKSLIVVFFVGFVVDAVGEIEVSAGVMV